jgi:hypothetical protein
MRDKIKIIINKVIAIKIEASLRNIIPQKKVYIMGYENLSFNMYLVILFKLSLVYLCKSCTNLRCFCTLLAGLYAGWVIEFSLPKTATD